MRLLLLAVLGVASLAIGVLASPSETFAPYLREILPDRGESTKKASRYLQAKVAPRRIASVVATTGSVTPVALFLVGSQLSGQITEILCDFNSEVQLGQPIAQINPASFQTEVARSEAELAIARANITKAKVGLGEAAAELERKADLLGRAVGSPVEHAKAKATRDIAAAHLADALSNEQKWMAISAQAKADLEKTIIRSPATGVVIHRSIEVGQIVAATLQTPILFTIAQDLRAMQLNLAVQESEIGRIKVGQRTEFVVDSYPEKTFEATVHQIRKQPQCLERGDAHRDCNGK